MFNETGHWVKTFFCDILNSASISIRTLKYKRYIDKCIAGESGDSLIDAMHMARNDTTYDTFNDGRTLKPWGLPGVGKQLNDIVVKNKNERGEYVVRDNMVIKDGRIITDNHIANNKKYTEKMGLKLKLELEKEVDGPKEILSNLIRSEDPKVRRKARIALTSSCCSNTDKINHLKDLGISAKIDNECVVIRRGIKDKSSSKLSSILVKDEDNAMKALDDVLSGNTKNSIRSELGLPASRNKVTERDII